MINDEQMLRSIMKNAEMGCRGINNIKHCSGSAELTRALRSQNLEYGRIYHNAHNMLRLMGSCGAHVSPALAALSKSVARRELKRDGTDSHIAEMMIQGNTIGVGKIARNIRRYSGNSKSVNALAQKLMATQQANIEQMKSFL